ncbi:unnamed protein product [Coffea canephora]|uniref:Uncharacterized protein n=1 Tax=Coffea canephora TaxID=49390 RepID=A0A068V8B3_COFCA|nr:unnamed protein product [Coffea canephora]
MQLFYSFKSNGKKSSSLIPSIQTLCQEPAFKSSLLTKNTFEHKENGEVACVGEETFPEKEGGCSTSI